MLNVSQIGCLASCGQFFQLYHLFCMQSNAIFHFYGSLHLFVLSANSLICLIHHVVLLFWCHINRMRSNLRSSAWNTELCKIMISYRLKYNKYRNFTVPVYRASLIYSEILIKYKSYKSLFKLQSLSTFSTVNFYQQKMLLHFPPNSWNFYKNVPVKY